LFDRSGVHPTILGELVLKYGEPIVRNVEDLQRELKLARGLEIGQLVLSVGPYPADISGRRAVGVLNARYPGLSIEFIGSNWSNTLKLVLEGMSDVGFAEISEAEAHPDLETELVRATPLQFFGAASNPLAARDRLIQDDLMDFPWVGPTAPGRMRAFLPSVDKPFGTFSTFNERFIPRILVETFADARDIVLAGEGLGVAVPFQLRREIASGSCRLLPLRLPWMRLNYGFITRRGRTLSPAARAFMATAREIERGLQVDDQPPTEGQG
ncbi:MAG TPA: substrate-binding domain-containing protein, partial [Rhodoblastus sp.]|nr:substrate-binding domain-containing protein [Rhodoblastus sp.]